MRETAKLLEHLPAIGHAVLSYDDEAVREMRERTKANVMTYGLTKQSDVRAFFIENKMDELMPLGIAFKIEAGGTYVPVRLDNVFGTASIQATLAGAAVGLILGMNLVKIAQALSFYQPLAGRLRIIKGIKNSYLLDDPYEATPLSTRLALLTLRDLPALRRIAVLGDMDGIGRYTIEAHEEIGRLATKAADILITVGARSKFIAEAAMKAKMGKRNIISFETAAPVKEKVQELIKKGDLVLVKGSRNLHLEAIVEEVMAEPQRAAELLIPVRV